MVGEPGQKLKQIWFICHGYGQLGNYFLKNFEALKDDSILLVSCEGLNRFYVNGFSGRVGASWMTREERTDDIQDYIAYLDAVYREVTKKAGKDMKITFFGFSQGTATVCRWFSAGFSRADRLVLWAGAFPPDVDLKLNRTTLNSIRLILVAGDSDEFISNEELTSMKSRFDESEITYDLIRFRGSHELNTETLKALLQF